MLLDQVTSSSANVADQIDGLAPGARDELAYVVLVGLLGTVPASLVSGEFRIGQLSLRYAWLTEAPIAGKVIAHSDTLKLVLSDGMLLPESESMAIGAILELWAFVQAHSDTLAFLPSSERHRWISSTAKAFGATNLFVQNLAANYPQLRRLCS